MLNLNCVICADLFNSTDDVSVTTCGHMFHVSCLNKWLERSKTCPQCRNKCNTRNFFRLYFNLANLDTSHVDIGSLQEQVDNANLQLKIKDKELNEAKEQIKSLKETQKKCMKTISGLEQKMQKNDFVILSYNEQIKVLKNEVKIVDDLRKQISELKFKLDSMEGVSSLLTASHSESEKLLANESNPKVLAVWVTTLKRELRQCETKKTNIRDMLKIVQSEVRKEVEKGKCREERISQLESENYQLQEKIKSLESSNSKTRDPLTKSPNAVHLAVKDIIDEHRRQTISPTIKEKVKTIEESVSPYLNIKSSSVGLTPLFKRNHETASIDLTNKTTTRIATIKVSPKKNTGALKKTSSDITEKYSIFKKPRLGLAAAAASAGSASLLKPLGPNIVFNGFGGTEKVDPFAVSSDDDDENNRTRKLPDPRFPSISRTNSMNLNVRLKAGGLKNFKINK